MHTCERHEHARHDACMVDRCESANTDTRHRMHALRDGKGGMRTYTSRVAIIHIPACQTPVRACTDTDSWTQPSRVGEHKCFRRVLVCACEQMRGEPGLKGYKRMLTRRNVDADNGHRNESQSRQNFVKWCPHLAR